MTMSNMNPIPYLKIVVLLLQLIGGVSQWTRSLTDTTVPSTSSVPTVTASPSTIYGISRGSCYLGSAGNHLVVCDQSESMCTGEGQYYYAPGYVSGTSGCCHCKASCEDLQLDVCDSFYDDTSAPTEEPVGDEPCRPKGEKKKKKEACVFPRTQLHVF